LLFSEVKKKKILSQKDYLKKYLSGGKKKKEKTKIVKRYLYQYIEITTLSIAML
jgi:hypothetical protein